MAKLKVKLTIKGPAGGRVVSQSTPLGVAVEPGMQLVLSLRRTVHAAKPNGRLRSASRRGRSATGSSTAFVSPIRGPVTTRPARSRASSAKRRRGRAGARRSSPVTPSAWQRRPGPEQSRRGSARPLAEPASLEPPWSARERGAGPRSPCPRLRRRSSGTSGSRRSGRRRRARAGRTSPRCAPSRPRNACEAASVGLVRPRPRRSCRRRRRRRARRRSARARPRARRARRTSAFSSRS